MAQSLTLRQGGNAEDLCRRAWWVFLIGGIASIAFGAFALLQPGVALFVLGMFFIASLLVDGVFNVIGAVRNMEKDGWWIMLLIGLLGVAVGGYGLLHPPMGALAFVYLFSFESIALGVILVLLGVKVRKVSSREWLLYASGAVSILFGVLVLAQPVVGALSIVWMIAGWSIVVGILRIVFALRMHNTQGGLQPHLGLPAQVNADANR